MTQILVVDDNPMVRKLLGVALSRHFSVSEAEDGLSAFEAIARHMPQMVFLDIMMPSANEGLELLERLRGDARTRHILVAMVTSRNDDEDRALCLVKGADAFFSKPFNLREITQWATTHLRPTGSEK